MWTDMSEIVRPTRDGIHGREFISTLVDIGSKPSFLTFDAFEAPVGEMQSSPLTMMLRFRDTGVNRLLRQAGFVIEGHV